MPLRLKSSRTRDRKRPTSGGNIRRLLPERSRIVMSFTVKGIKGLFKDIASHIFFIK